MSAKARNQALSIAATAVDVSHWIAERFTTPTPNVPQLFDLAPTLAADALRREWGLGEAPLPHSIDLLEAHGVRVFSLPTEIEDADANSFWRDGQPFVLLNRSKSSERTRFDVGHELGHLTMHDEGSESGKQAEREANKFASALLMPQADVLARIPQGPTLSDLISLKRRWGVSLSALTYRVHELELSSDWQYRDHFIDISRRGFRTEEPDGLPAERSQILDKIIAACASRGASLADIADQLSLPANDVRAMFFDLQILAGSSTRPPPVRTSRPDLHVVV